jgi:hypothetical protein
VVDGFALRIEHAVFEGNKNTALHRAVLGHLSLTSPMKRRLGLRKI